VSLACDACAAYFAVLPHDATGGWESVFGVAIAADLLTAVLAIAVLKPIRRRYLAGTIG